jgi:hypothetical protein
VKFVWSGAVQTTCEFCHSILVRSDDALERVGLVADLPANASPIQLLTEGQFRGRAFQVIGRIIYEYELGSWNEWHLIFPDGSSGWLSDAQLEYALSVLVQPKHPLPRNEEALRGKVITLRDTEYVITSRTEARYRGVEGELPFQFYGKELMTFADLRTADGKFGTIDYSEDPPLLFLGEPVEFRDLNLKNLRQFEGWM